MPGADLLITNSLNLLVSLITVNTQYIKVRYQSFQEILKIKEYSNLFKRPHAIGRPTLNLIYQCLFLKGGEFGFSEKGQKKIWAKMYKIDKIFFKKAGDCVQLLHALSC